MYVVVVCVADIIKESLCAYSADDMPRFKTVVAFDCRGIEPTDFEPRVCSFLYQYCMNSTCCADSCKKSYTLGFVRFHVQLVMEQMLGPNLQGQPGMVCPGNVTVKCLSKCLNLHETIYCTLYIHCHVICAVMSCTLRV